MKLLEKLMLGIMCIYLFILPINSFKVDKIEMLFFGILILYNLLCFIIKSTRKKAIMDLIMFFKDALCLAILIFVVIMCISISYSKDKSIALSETIRFFSYIMIFYTIKFKFNEKSYIKKIIMALYCSTAVVAVIGIYQYITGGKGVAKEFKTGFDYTKVKIPSTLGNPNSLAAFMVIAIFPIIMMIIYEKNKLKKSLYVLFTLAMFFNIVFTYSRSSYVGIGVGLICLLFFYSLKMLVVLVPVFLFGFFNSKVRERVLNIASSSENVTRFKLWKIALKMVKDHPVLGVGNGNYVTRYDEYVKRYPYLEYGYSHFPAHNSYLKVFSELGIIGMVNFISIIILSIIHVKKFVDTTDDKFFKYFFTGFLAATIAFLVMNTADNLFFVPKVATFFWVLLALSEAAYLRERNL